MELTVGFERKLRPDDFRYDFETEGASVFLKGSVSDELGDDQTTALAELAATLFAVAKIRVLTELGLEFVSDENGIVRETERIAATTVTQLPGTTVVQQIAPAPAAVQPAPVQYVQAPAQVAPPAPAPVQAIAPPPAGAVAVAPPAGDPSKDQLIQMYLQNPGDWYDNRATATAKQPIFRHKKLKLSTGYNAGLWRQDFEAAGYQV